MNGDSKKIFERVGKVETHCIEMRKDIEYIKESFDKHMDYNDELTRVDNEKFDKMSDRVAVNSKNIYLVIGGAIVVSTIISIIMPLILSIIF